MPRIPMPLGLTGSENLPRTQRSLINCFNNKQGQVLSRPGILQLNTTSGAARGNFKWNGSLYQVYGTDLIKITNLVTGAFSTIGTIAGSAVIQTEVGLNHVLINAKGGSKYTLDKSDTLVDITGNANMKPADSIAHIDGRFVYIPTDGSPAFFSDVGAAGTINALSFFDAEELPDLNNGAFNINNTLYITGTNSIQKFRNTGGTPNPFPPIPGSRIQNGVIGGLMEYGGTYLFVGREKDQDYGIYAVGQGEAPKISNERVDLILSTYTIEELSQVITGRFKWRGYDFATFTFRRDTIAFVLGNWIRLDTIIDGVSRPWAAGYIAEFEGEYYTAYSNKIGKFAKVNEDYGERITRVIDMGYEEEDGNKFSCQSIELGISQGYNAADGSVALFMSRDNVLYGQPLYRNLGDLGEYWLRLKWNYAGGLGNYQGFMGTRFYTTEDIIFSADQVIATLR